MADYYWAGSGAYPISIMTANWQNASGTPYASYMASTDTIYISKPGLGGTTARTFYWPSAMTDGVRQIAAIYHTDAYNTTHLYNNTGSGTYRFGTISNSNSGSSSVTFGVTGTSTTATQLNVQLEDDGVGLLTGTISASDPIIFLCPVTNGTTSTTSPARIQVVGSSYVEFRNTISNPSGGLNTTRLTIGSGGTAFLAGSNTYSGGTLVYGTATISNAAAFGDSTGANGHVDLYSNSTVYISASLSTLNNYKFRQNGSYKLDNQTTGLVACDLGTGAYQILANSTITVNRSNATYTISGVITATTFDIKKDGPGKLVLSGLPASFAGMSVTDGVLRVTTPTFFSNATGTLTVGGTSTAYGTFSNGVSSNQLQSTLRPVIVSGDTAGFETYSTNTTNCRMSFSTLNGPGTTSSTTYNLHYDALLGPGGSGTGAFTQTGLVFFNQPLAIDISSNMVVTYATSLKVNTSLTLTGAGLLALTYTSNAYTYAFNLSGKCAVKDDLTLGPVMASRTVAVTLNQGGELQFTSVYGSPNTVTLANTRAIAISSSTTSVNPCKIYSDGVDLTIPDIASTATGGYLTIYGLQSGRVRFSGTNSPYDGTVEVAGRFFVNVEKGMPNSSFVTKDGGNFHVRNTTPTNNYVLYCKTLTLSGGSIVFA